MNRIALFSSILLCAGISENCNDLFAKDTVFTKPNRTEIKMIENEFIYIVVENLKAGTRLYLQAENEKQRDH